MNQRDLFREIYKNRVIEAVLGGGKARRFYVYVDGFAADHFTRYGTNSSTTTFGSRTAAFAAAKASVDRNIAYQSYLRRHDPQKALERAEQAYSKAIEDLEHTRREVAGKTRIWVWPDRLIDAQQHLADAALRVERTKHDLELASKAMPPKPPQ